VPTVARPAHVRRPRRPIKPDSESTDTISNQACAEFVVRENDVRHLISAGGAAEADGYIGYMKPYATSHRDLDDDKAFQEEVLNAARALGAAVELARTGHLENPAKGLADPNPK